jgi:hypothetical protein
MIRFEKCWGINTPTFLKPIHCSYQPVYEYGTDSVPKRRHIKFRRRGITQKKAQEVDMCYRFYVDLLFIIPSINARV